MILNISIKNYRSFKDEVIFTMIAESSKSKEQNVFIQPLAKGEDEVSLLKTAIIYGANASGKSNLLRTVFEIVRFIGASKPKAGQNIPAYDPFKFDDDSNKAPIEFKIEFVGKDNIKYKYELTFDLKNVVKEVLTYWPNNKPVTLFTRLKKDELDSLVHVGKLGLALKSREIEVFHNQAILSKFGDEVPNEIISEVYVYISKIKVVYAFNTNNFQTTLSEVSRNIEKDPSLLEKINELIRLADTGLNGINVTKRDEKEMNFPESISLEIRKAWLSQFGYSISGIHSFYKDSKLIDSNVSLPFDQESNGTRAIFALGGKILEAIEAGDTLFIDELETSLHPFLSKLLVCLFQNERINAKNAQLIFTTHDTTLLDRLLFRKDQIWFAEKNEFGVTTMYSLQDFADVREDTPFDKWYLAGKFGGIPNIKSLESLFIK